MDDEADVGDVVVVALNLEDACRTLFINKAAKVFSLVRAIRPESCLLDSHLFGITALQLANLRTPQRARRSGLSAKALSPEQTARSGGGTW